MRSLVCLMSVHWLGAGVCTHQASTQSRLLRSQSTLNTEVMMTVHEDFMTPTCLYTLTYLENVITKYIGFIGYAKFKCKMCLNLEACKDIFLSFWKQIWHCARPARTWFSRTLCCGCGLHDIGVAALDDLLHWWDGLDWLKQDQKDL